MSLRDAAARVRRALAAPPTPVWQRLRDEGVLSVGEGTYGVEALSLPEYRLPDGTWLGGRLVIGAYCSIGPAEVVLGGNHRTEHVGQYPFASMLGVGERRDDSSTRGDVRIGSDVWVGGGATILSGVTIGDGAVVGARAVVSRDVRPYAVVVGNPAREVRRRFDDATVERLLALRWWDWPADEVRRRWRELAAPPGPGQDPGTDTSTD